MKSLLLVLVTAFTFSAFAAEDVKLVCQKYSRKTGDVLNGTVVLQQLGKGKLEEGTPMEFLLETFDAVKTWSDVSVKGTVETEDVNFFFESNDGKYTFKIYMDELDECSFYIDGKDQGDYVCR